MQCDVVTGDPPRVSWAGEQEKRRLELNWVAPFDLQPGDYVGLYRNDPQWVGPGSPELTVAASKPGGYHLTEVQFPDINRLQQSTSISHVNLQT